MRDGLLRLSARRAASGEETPDAVRVLVDNHARFLAFLERRVESREVAEDILQDAFVRGLDAAAGLRDQESVTSWFYRLLRNAIVDHYRRRSAETRALARVAAETAEAVAVPADEELLRAVCGCVTGLLATLKPDYAVALQRVDLDGVAVQAFAGEAGITPANASVRLHRARETLRKQLVRTCGACTKHECLDCTCKQSSPSG